MEKSKAKELAEYITEQLAGLEDIRKTPMMGGYIFYYRERIFGGIYGSGFMVKITEASRKYMPDRFTIFSPMIFLRFNTR